MVEREVMRLKNCYMQPRLNRWKKIMQFAGQNLEHTGEVKARAWDPTAAVESLGQSQLASGCESLPCGCVQRRLIRVLKLGPVPDRRTLGVPNSSLQNSASCTNIENRALEYLGVGASQS